MSSLRRRTTRLLLVAVLASAGCGQSSNTDGAVQADDIPQANKRAKQVLISAEQLPDEYRMANGQEFPGEVKLCDLTLQPDGIRGFAMKRYTYSALGPFLYQYVFVASDAANRSLIRQLRRTLQNCHRDAVVTDKGTKIAFRVTPLRKLPRFGQESTGFRRAPEPEGASSEYLLIRDDDVSVLLFTVAPEGIPPPREVLLDGAGAATRTLREN